MINAYLNVKYIALFIIRIKDSLSIPKRVVIFSVFSFYSVSIVFILKIGVVVVVVKASIDGDL